MGNSQDRDFEKTLRYIKKLESIVDVYFDGGITVRGAISYVGSDFVELETRVPGGKRKLACPFWSIQYVSADYETPQLEQLVDAPGER